MTPAKVLLSRWQFGVTITYHFLFVPLTIGLAFLVAIMQVQAYRTRDQTWEDEDPHEGRPLTRTLGVAHLGGEPSITKKTI